MSYEMGRKRGIKWIQTDLRDLFNVQLLSRDKVIGKYIFLVKIQIIMFCFDITSDCKHYPKKPNDSKWLRKFEHKWGDKANERTCPDVWKISFRIAPEASFLSFFLLPFK